MAREFLCRGVNGDWGNEDCGVCGERRGLWPKPLVAYVLGDAEERSRLEGFRRRLEGVSGEEGMDGMLAEKRYKRRIPRYGEARRSVMRVDVGYYRPTGVPSCDIFFR